MMYLGAKRETLRRRVAEAPHTEKGGRCGGEHEIRAEIRQEQDAGSKKQKMDHV